MGGPAPAPMGAPRKEGPSIGLILGIGCGGLLVLGAIIGLVVMLAFRDGGGSGSSARGPDPSDLGEEGKDFKRDELVYIESRRPDVKFIKPPGWERIGSGRWGVFKAPDGLAVLGFVGFNRPGESTALLGEATQVLGVTNIVWNDRSSGVIGKDQFPAQIGSGICNFRGPGTIAYATVNPGGVDQLLIIYTVADRADKRHAAAVKLTLKSLQRL
jgi:hypothetical protein